MRCKVASRTFLLLSLSLVPLASLTSCAEWFFSGEHWVDRSQPVALLETTGGVEFGATTELGILSLGRTATEGPCRVHYLVGETPLIESGELHATGSVFTEARIDLKTQLARVLDRAPTEDDALSVMWTPDGESVRSVTVRLARSEGLAGDLLRDPGVELPAGATVLCRGPVGNTLIAGLISGRVTIASGPDRGRYYVFAGVDRMRELLAVPRKFPEDQAPKYRTDDISVMKPIPPKAESQPEGEGNGLGESQGAAGSVPGLVPGLLPGSTPTSPATGGEPKKPGGGG